MRTGDAAGLISITVGRFGSEPQEVSVARDSTIRDALAEVGITPEADSKIYVNGQRASLRDLLDEGDIVNVVVPKQAGARA